MALKEQWALMSQRYDAMLDDQGKSIRTRVIYLHDAIEPLGRFLEQCPEIEAAEDIRSRHVSAYIGAVRKRTSYATANQVHRSLKTWFRWLITEGVIDQSPMDALKAPRLDSVPVETIPEDVLRKLFASLSKTRWEDIRDRAMLSVLLDTGLRRAELVNMQIGDIDLMARRLVVTGKGRKTRILAFSTATALDIERYLRVRPRHCTETCRAVWVSTRTKGGIEIQMVKEMLNRRTKRLNLPHIHPHQFRHTYAAMYMMAGGEITALQHLMGHADISTTTVYLKYSVGQRALAEHDRLSPLDRLTKSH